jgi:hypothetical protein
VTAHARVNAAWHRPMSTRRPPARLAALATNPVKPRNVRQTATPSDETSACRANARERLRRRIMANDRAGSRELTGRAAKQRAAKASAVGLTWARRRRERSKRMRAEYPDICKTRGRTLDARRPETEEARRRRRHFTMGLHDFNSWQAASTRRSLGC